MADHPQAMADLRLLLEARQPLYATADLVVDTSGRSVDAVADEVRSLVQP
jgi:XRE family aerobic/anaerobic benzoate catabolism transcriptional regulator